jgi:membrane protease YdiL (CAAX protease family)
VWKTWLYVAGSVCLGAAAAPYLADAGTALAEVAEFKPTNRPLDRLADACRAADFRRYYQVSLLAAALLLFLPWRIWLGGGGRGPADDPGRPPPPPRRGPGPRHGLAGLLLAGGVFLLLGVALLHAGSFTWRAEPAAGPRLLAWLLGLSIASAAVQEWIFRGAALGVFLRGTRPAAAITMNAMLFAGVHLIARPPATTTPADEEARTAGFEMVGSALARAGDPLVITGFLLPLVALGAVLGHARWRTGSLWLPAGLHGGLIFAAAAFGSVAEPLPRGDTAAAMLAGPSPASGLIPLMAIITLGLLVRLFTTLPDARPRRPIE